MQAPQGPGGGSGLTTALQNRNVQIGLGVVGLVVLIVVITLLVMNNQSSGGTSTAVKPALSPTALSGPSSMTGSDDVSTATPAAATGAGGASFGTPAGTGATTATATTTAATGDQPKRMPPGVQTRPNPFQPNTELRKVIADVPPPPRAPEYIADAHALYQELNPAKPATRVVSEFEDEAGGPPIPPMRVAGFVEGAQLSAILQIGSGAAGTYVQAIPGKMIQYGANTYRVESIEQGKVTLVNRWEIGDRKGTQRIDVELAAAASRAPAFAAPIYGGQTGGAPAVGPSTTVGGDGGK